MLNIVLDNPTSTTYLSREAVYPESFGAIGDGVANDAVALQAAINYAILKRKKLVLSPNVSYRFTSTLNVVPATGNEVYLDIECHGSLTYIGTAGTAAIRAIGLRFSHWIGLKINLGNNINLIAVDLDTDGNSSSTSFNTFINCDVVLGTGTGQNAWRLGHVSANGGDISDLQWQTCLVYGKNPVVNGHIGWHIEGSNTLQNVWVNTFGAFLDKMYSNLSGAGASASGNGAVYFFGAGASQNNLDFEIANAQSYVISGGRFESGKRVLTVLNSNVSPSIVFQGTEINDYEPGGTDRILFYLDMPCSMMLTGCNIKSGTHPQYDNKMITCYGGGGGAGIGRLFIDGGAVEAAKDSFYRINLNATVWKPYIRGVGRLVGGVCTEVMTDHSGS